MSTPVTHGRMLRQTPPRMLQSTANKTAKLFTMVTWTKTTPPRNRSSAPLLRDEGGVCYFGPAVMIDAILNVNNYVHVVPVAPLEELHASSVQHPNFPAMRWLMNTRRVPVLSPPMTSGQRRSAGVIASDTSRSVRISSTTSTQTLRPTAKFTRPTLILDGTRRNSRC